MRFDLKQSRYSRYARGAQRQQKRLIIYLVLLVLVVVAMITLRHKDPRPAHTDARPITWLTDFETAAARAKVEGKPVMAYFFTEGNAACARMERATFADNAVRTETRKFVCVRINGASDRLLAKRHYVIIYPSIVFISPGGESYVVLDYRTPNDLLAEMRRALAPAATGTQPADLIESPTLPPKNAGPSSNQ